MPTNFPSTLDSFTAKVDNVDDVMADHVNKLQDAVLALETKVGVTSSGVTSTLDYLLKNSSSVDPGHKHSNLTLNSLNATKLTFSGLTAGHAFFASGSTAAEFRAVQESDIVDGSLLARLAANEVISGMWEFPQGVELTANGGLSSVKLTAPSAGTGVITYALPDTDGATGEVLATDGAGTLYWTTGGGGSSLPSGTAGQTLRCSGGTAWAVSSALELLTNGVRFRLGTNGWFTLAPITIQAILSGSQHVIASAIPAGSLVFGVFASVLKDITGITGFDLGTPDNPTAWGANVSGSLGNSTDGRNVTSVNPAWFPAATNLVLTPRGGSFPGGTSNHIMLVILALTVTAPSA